MVGVRAGDALIRVYGRDAWGWPVGVRVHTFDGAGDEQTLARVETKAVA